MWFLHVFLQSLTLCVVYFINIHVIGTYSLPVMCIELLTTAISLLHLHFTLSDTGSGVTVHKVVALKYAFESLTLNWKKTVYGLIILIILIQTGPCFVLHDVPHYVMISKM